MLQLLLTRVSGGGWRLEPGKGRFDVVVEADRGGRHRRGCHWEWV